MAQVLYMDPPWGYQVTKCKAAINFKGKFRYPTMSWTELKQMELPSSPDANVYVWATAPSLPHQLEVLKAWGLHSVRVYRVWIKLTRRQQLIFQGVGYYTQSNAEFLLVAQRGKGLSGPLDRSFQVVRHIRLEHSVKPSIFRDIVASATPGRQRMEMFARSNDDKRFHVHGNQTTLLSNAKTPRDQKHRLSSVEHSTQKGTTIPRERHSHTKRPLCGTCGQILRQQTVSTRSHDGIGHPRLKPSPLANAAWLTFAQRRSTGLQARTG